MLLLRPSLRQFVCLFVAMDILVSRNMSLHACCDRELKKKREEGGRREGGREEGRREGGGREGEREEGRRDEEGRREGGGKERGKERRRREGESEEAVSLTSVRTSILRECIQDCRYLKYRINYTNIKGPTL